MDKNVISTLEFDKIIEHLAQLPVSPLGQKLILQIKPLSEPAFITQKLNETSELRDILDFDDPFPLSGLQDITEQLSKLNIHGTFLSTEELVQISRTLEVARKINMYFIDREDKYPLLFRLVKQISTFKNIEDEIKRCIDSSGYQVYDHASPELNRIRRSIIRQEEQIRKRLEGMVAAFSARGYLQENLITLRNNRLVLMVKDEHKNKVKGLVHDQSATGATLFIEPLETLELNNKIRSLKIDEQKEVERILLRLSNLIRDRIDDIQQTVDALARIDFIYAKARFSKEIDGHSPAVNQQNKLEIIAGRHPLLVLRYGAAKEVVPINVTIGEEFNTMVISGPNAGGKTVALKTIGLLSLMTVHGLHIPADPSSDIAIFHKIFATIGDQQSIENDLSTFSSHVASLKQIVDSVDQKNLVLIDEIGSGTDPDEGAALAIAILEKLTSLGCITVVSTHLGALKVFAHETKGVENGSMEFDRETLQPTYHFRVGIPGSSYAYEIARRMGIPENITRRARQLVGSRKNQVERLLADLEDRLQKYRTLTNDLSIKQSQLDSLIKLYEQKTKEFRTKENTLKKEAVEQAEQIIQNANITIEQAIKQIREAQANRESIKQAKELIRQQKKLLEKEKRKLSLSRSEDKSQKEFLKMVSIGQKVYWEPFKSQGVVLSKADASGRVLIQIGDVKIKAPIQELYPVKESREKKTPVYRLKISDDVNKLKTNEIDIRGYRVEEGIAAVDKFLDEAILAGLDQIYIIHGKGTGRLREGVFKYLDKHPRVKSRSYPDWSLGDTGMTVVKLK